MCIYTCIYIICINCINNIYLKHSNLIILYLLNYIFHFWGQKLQLPQYIETCCFFGDPEPRPTRKPQWHCLFTSSFNLIRHLQNDSSIFKTYHFPVFFFRCKGQRLKRIFAASNEVMKSDIGSSGSKRTLGWSSNVPWHEVTPITPLASMPPKSCPNFLGPPRNVRTRITNNYNIMMIKCRHGIFWIGTWSFKFLWCWNWNPEVVLSHPKGRNLHLNIFNCDIMADWQKSCQKNTHTHTHHIGAGFWPFFSLKLFPPWNSHGFWCFFCCMFCCHENWNVWILIKNWVTVLLPQALPCHSLRWNLGASHGLGGINLDRWFDLDEKTKLPIYKKKCVINEDIMGYNC